MTTPPTQIISATAGVAYGVIGADLHVFGDGSPLYLLENWRPPAPPNSAALREQPSRMLNAHHAVVEFTGREAELAKLREWRDGRPRLMVRWLHGPGGQGKSRLAARLAEESLARGWKVISAIHGPGTVLPADRQEDMTPGGAAGVLVIVDYADQWPLTHLTWFFSNALLHRSGLPTRVLLVARTLDAWPMVRAMLANHLAGTSAQALPALEATEERADMFRAARDSFARHYDVPDPQAIAVPELAAADLGLTLGVHMAALVSVDAFATGARRPPPDDLAALAAYLLDREQLHWARLHSEETHRLDPSGRTFTTAPAAMNYAVFLAALTGSVTREAGLSLLASPPVELDADRTLADHAICYPPIAAGSVLEPLYPDRLAEDFLALTVAGHPVDYPGQRWAAPAVATVLHRPEEEDAPPWTPRAVTFLASAAARWAHVGPNCLFPVLREDPDLAVEAGSAALVALAGSADQDLVESLAMRLPEGRNVDLDVGAAAVVQRATAERLATVDTPEMRASFLAYLGQRLSYAGRTQEALEPTREALAIRRRLAGEWPGYLLEVADALNLLGILLTDLGQREEALAHTIEAVQIYREEAEPSYMISLGVEYLPKLAITLANAARLCLELGDPHQALEHAKESAAIDAELAGKLPGEYLASYAESVAMVGSTLSTLGRDEEALIAEEQAAQVLSALADADPATHLPALADVLNNMGITLSKLGRMADALPPMTEAVRIERRLAQANPGSYLPGLALALNNLGTRYAELGEFAEALPVAEESVQIHTRLADSNPAAHLDGLAMALHNLSSAQMTMGFLHHDPERFRLGIETEQRALEIKRDLAAASPAAHDKDLAGYLTAFGAKLSQAGRHREGLAPTEEAVTLFRRLAEQDPVAHRPGLALALTSFATVRATGGLDLDRAHAAYQEAFAIGRELEADHPGQHLINLAAGLLGFAMARATSGATTEAALAAIEEAVAIYEHIVEAMPDNQLQVISLMGSYHLLAQLLEESGRGEEAAGLREELAEQQREAERLLGR